MKITKEKIFKQEDGSRVKLEVEFDLFRSKFEYLVRASTCEAGKRKFSDAIDSDGFRYRKASMEERKLMLRNKAIELLTEEKVISVALELWQSLKPNLDTNI